MFPSEEYEWVFQAYGISFSLLFFFSLSLFAEALAISAPQPPE